MNLNNIAANKFEKHEIDSNWLSWTANHRARFQILFFFEDLQVNKLHQKVNVYKLPLAIAYITNTNALTLF